MGGPGETNGVPVSKRDEVGGVRGQGVKTNCQSSYASVGVPLNIALKHVARHFVPLAGKAYGASQQT